MKLDKNFSLEILKDKKEKLIKSFSDNSSIDSNDKELHQLLETDNKLKYIFSKSVIQTLDSIKIGNKFDFNILKERTTKNGIIIIDKTELYIFQEQQDKLRVMNFTISIKENYSDQQVFTFNLEKNQEIVDDTIEEHVWKKFLQCIIYLDFLPTETKYIKPNEKTGTRKTDKIINNTDNELILVTKAWNTEYKTELGKEFYSKPHWGIRWTGSGRNISKVVFVNGSFKKLNKKPEKETKR